MCWKNILLCFHVSLSSAPASTSALSSEEPATASELSLQRRRAGQPSDLILLTGARRRGVALRARGAGTFGGCWNRTKQDGLSLSSTVYLALHSSVLWRKSTIADRNWKTIIKLSTWVQPPRLPFVSIRGRQMISIGLFAGSLFLTTAADPTTFGTGSTLLHKGQLISEWLFGIFNFPR